MMSAKFFMKFMLPGLIFLSAGSPAWATEPQEQDAALRAQVWQVVSAALSNSPALDNALALHQAALERINMAQAQRLPQVSLTANSRSQTIGQGAKPRNDQAAILNLNIATTLFDFGHIRYQVDSSRQQARAAALNFDAKQEELALQLSSALVEWSKQREVVALSEDHIERIQRLTLMLKKIVQVDVGRRSELTQANGDLLKAGLQRDRSMALAQEYQNLLSRYVDTQQKVMPLGWAIPATAFLAHHHKPEDHPQLRLTQAQSDAAWAEARATGAAQLPKLSLVAGKSTAKEGYGREQAFQASLQLSWPLYNGGGAQAAQDEAIYRAKALQYQAEDIQRELQQNLRLTELTLEAGLKRERALEELVVTSDRIRNDFFQQWATLGKRTLLDVLNAENEYFTMRVEQVTNRYDSYTTLFRGYASSGQLISWLQHREG